MPEPIDYELLRERVEKGVKQQKNVSRVVFFVVNLMFFLFFMGFAWWSAMANPEFAELTAQMRETIELMLIMPTVGWGTAIFLHLMSILIDFGVGERELRARVTAREISDQLLDDKLHEIASRKSEKPKRHESDSEAALADDAAADEGRMVLSDDGELRYLDDAVEKDAKRRYTR